MNDSFSALINSAVSILIVLPEKPNFDAAASGLALYLSIREAKEALIYCPSPITVGLNRLIGVNKISSELGNKNLTIKFAGYDAKNIEKVSYDIENGEFKLTVVPKAGFTAPGKDQLDLGFSGISADLIVLIGGSDEHDFQVLSAEELAGAKVAHIGVRALTSARAVMSFASPGASVSEVIARIIKENNLSLDADVATNLVMGIEEGSSNFASSEVTPDTFEIFAFLLRNGGQRPPKTRLSPMGFPPGSIPTQPFLPAKPVQDVQPEVVPEKIEGKEDPVENPPDDWLQPKVYKGATSNKPNSFSENKG
jgi:hypothetical protein